MGITPETRVLDVGGSFYNWRLSPVVPRLTIINLDARHPDCPAEVEWIRGDATQMPFEDQSFDVAFSNSVIEHLGSWPAQRRFAKEVLRVAQQYWVQTPNYRFPIEPHFLGLGVQYLPTVIARPYIRYATPWGWRYRESRQRIDELLAEIHLLTKEDLTVLFPDGDLIPEHVAGLTKSLVIHRRSNGIPHTPSRLPSGR